MTVFNFKDKSEFISYLLKGGVFFHSRDHLEFEFDFQFQEFIEYFPSSSIPSKSKSFTLSNIHFKKSMELFSNDTLEFDSLTIENCIFNNELLLQNLHIYGQFKYYGSSIPLLTFHQSIINQSCSIKMQDNSIATDMAFMQMKIQGDLELDFKNESSGLLQQTPDNSNDIQPNNFRNNANFSISIYAVHNAIIVSPIFIDSVLNGNLTINTENAVPHNNSPINIQKLSGYSHIATNNGILTAPIFISSNVNKNIYINTKTDIRNYNKDIDVATLQNIPGNQYLASNVGCLSTINLQNSTIKGSIHNNSTMLGQNGTPYTLSNNHKCFAINCGLLAQSNIYNSTVENITTTISPNIPKPSHGEITFHSKVDFFQYLQDNLIKDKSVIIKTNDSIISLEFDLVLDELYNFLNNTLRVPVDKITFSYTEFKKKLIFSNSKNINIEFNNCLLHTNSFQKKIAENVSLTYHNTL
ncbi:MAG: hypothetical protein ACRCTQ_06975 [Brevinemataceae bacterium]